MPIPEMQTVSSSNVASVGYDVGDQTVYIQFLSGSTFAYKGVQEQEYEKLRTAPSIGAYLDRNFKNVYPYQRVG